MFHAITSRVRCIPSLRTQLSVGVMLGSSKEGYSCPRTRGREAVVKSQNDAKGSKYMRQFVETFSQSTYPIRVVFF